MTYAPQVQNIILEIFINVMREFIFASLGPYLVMQPWDPQSTSEKPVPTSWAQRTFQLFLIIDVKL